MAVVCIHLFLIWLPKGISFTRPTVDFFPLFLLLNT